MFHAGISRVVAATWKTAKAKGLAPRLCTRCWQGKQQPFDSNNPASASPDPAASGYRLHHSAKNYQSLVELKSCDFCHRRAPLVGASANKSLFLSCSQATQCNKITRLMGVTIVAPIQGLEELQSSPVATALFARLTCDFSRGVDELAGRSNSALASLSAMSEFFKAR